MTEDYIAIMIQSLKKKIQILDEIIRLDLLQKEQLTNPDCPVDEFDQTVEDKSKMIEQIEQLDSGFDKLYAHVKTELNENREAHKEEIKTMQQCIKSITDKSVEIQAQEARNKELMKQKFSMVKRQAKTVRANSKATASYYQSMSKMNTWDPQFMDNKK